MEEFLKKFLGGKLEPPTQDDFDGANLLINNQEIEIAYTAETIGKIIEDLRLLKI